MHTDRSVESPLNGRQESHKCPWKAPPASRWMITSSPKRSQDLVNRESAAQQGALSCLSSAAQRYSSFFPPHLCPGEAISGSNHRSVCILLESLPPPL